MRRLFLISLAILCRIQAQNGTFTLESVVIEGTTLSRETVLDLAGLHIGASVDQAAFEAAGQKLNDSGLFESVSYHFGPSQHKGYILTLTLADPRLINAAIDIPGINEDEQWRWLAARYPFLDHKVPANDAGQMFVARKLEEHLAQTLEGHHIVTQVESDLMRGRSLILFEPDPLPRVASIKFTGEMELTAEQLGAVIPQDVREHGYSGRSFRQAVELNLRRAYEERGMYRVRFPTITAERQPGWSVSATVAIEEGPKYTLGDVQIVGDNLPVDAMLKAANFHKNEIANWTEIQNSLYELEKPVKRLGYLNAASVPERILHDDQHVLDVKVSFRLGPLFRLGQVQFVGLAPNVEEQARKIWGPKPGDPFDYEYPTDFFKAFSRTVDSRLFKRVKATMRKGSSDNVMDFVVTFEPR